LRAPRNRRWLLVQIVIAAIVIGSIGYALVKQWREFRGTPLTTDLHWEFVLLSGAVVLLTYGVLIETWRRMLAAWGKHLAFGDAVRITCISKLGIYVPGRIWQVSTMAVMAQQAGISSGAAAASAVVSTAVNIAVGMAIALIAGWRAVDIMSGGHANVGVVLVVIALAGLLALPKLAPPAIAWIQRKTGREPGAAAFPRRAVYIAVAGNVVAWVLYGIAFQLFVRGILGKAPGTTSAYVAAYSASYLIGYLMFVIPGGLGVREGALILAMPALGLATDKQAAVIAVTSRLWLTVLEIVPGLYFWARRTPPPSKETTPRNGSKQ